MHLLRTWRITSVCFWESKSDYLLPTGKVPTPLCLTHRARASARSSPSCTLRSIFRPVKEKKTWLTRTHCQTTSDISPEEWGGRSQSTREGTNPRDDCMKKIWRSCYLFGTKSFSGDRKDLLHFFMLPVRADYPVFHTGTWVSREGREILAPGLPPFGRFSPAVARVGVRSVGSAGCPWLVTLKLLAYSACITCMSKESKRTLPSQWALAASAGGAVRLYFMVRKAQNFYQPKTFLFFLSFCLNYRGVFQVSSGFSLTNALTM